MLLRRSAIAICDILILNLSYVCASALFYDGGLTQAIKECLIGRSWYASIIFVAVLYFFGLYNSMWEYAGLHELTCCLGAVVTSTLVTLGVDTICERFEWFHVEWLRTGVYFFAMLLTFFLSGALRLCYRSLRTVRRVFSRQGAKQPRIMIIGAGDTGITIYREFEAKNFATGRPVVFVDDDPLKQGHHVGFVSVLGGCEKIPEIAEKYNIDEIILAVPSIKPERRSELLKIAVTTGCKLKTSLSFEEITEHPDSGASVRNVEITDLLARPEIKLNNAICAYLHGQTVMVTGGGGSI
ncbi:MAG TPA: hypothetical protein DDY98_07130, partial [Ruminococcaceae bacterium]|nr:hypothetical protein [Oscillospiraceae bacterium]